MSEGCTTTTFAGAVECQLPAGHDGPHRNETDDALITWEPRYVGDLRRRIEVLETLVEDLCEDARPLLDEIATRAMTGHTRAMVDGLGRALERADRTLNSAEAT